MVKKKNEMVPSLNADVVMWESMSIPLEAANDKPRKQNGHSLKTDWVFFVHKLHRSLLQTVIALISHKRVQALQGTSEKTCS